MSVNIFLNTNTDSALDPPIELTALTCEFKLSLSCINRVFDNEMNHIESASPDELNKMIVNWEIAESESFKEIKNSYWLAKRISGALRLSTECVFPEISPWYIRISLQKLLQDNSVKAMNLDVKDFAEQKVLEVKERLKGALINWKVNQTRLIRQEYAKELLLGSNS